MILKMFKGKQVQVQFYVKKIRKVKNGQIFKMKLLFAIKLNFYGSQFYWDISNFGYFNNFQIILKQIRKLQKLNICDGKLIKMRC